MFSPPKVAWPWRWPWLVLLAALWCIGSGARGLNDICAHVHLCICTWCLNETVTPSFFFRWENCDSLTHQPRVPGLPIRECARGCNNREHTRTQLSAIDVTGKAFFERLYLVPGLSPSEPRVHCPYAPTPPPLVRQLFLDFRAFFSHVAPHFLSAHDSPSNIAESRYPPSARDHQILLTYSYMCPYANFFFLVGNSNWWQQFFCVGSR